jgi:hypothetical protein
MTASAQTSDFSVDYDAPAVAEAELDEVQYRLDAGFRGAIAVSSRAAGTWSWSLLAEGKWDGVRLKVKSLERPVVSALESALRAAAQNSE